MITNRHVAKEFSRQSGRSWVFEPGMKGRIDFHEEFGGGPAAEFSLTEVIGVHDPRHASSARRSVPPARRSAAAQARADELAPAQGAGGLRGRVPASDSRRNDPDEMRRIFDNIYNVKRLQPGELKRVSGSTFEHDCSTLGGTRDRP